jgi:hypothetical protein
MANTLDDEHEDGAGDKGSNLGEECVALNSERARESERITPVRAGDLAGFERERELSGTQRQRLAAAAEAGHARSFSRSPSITSSFRRY